MRRLIRSTLFALARLGLFLAVANAFVGVIFAIGVEVDGLTNGPGFIGFVGFSPTSVGSLEALASFSSLVIIGPG